MPNKSGKITKQISDKAVEILSNTPKGRRFSELVRELLSIFPNHDNTVYTQVGYLDKNCPTEVYKPGYGLYRHIRFQDTAAITNTAQPVSPLGIKEENFYQEFANWLINELGECSRAVSLGGKISNTKWGTPDVIGIQQPEVDDIIKYEIEIISGELKLASEPVVALGQAVAYTLFSNKVYLALPNTISDEDYGRIDILCQQLGIGLTIFNEKKPKEPEFEIRTRAKRLSPEPFYMNLFLKSLRKTAPEKYKQLF